MGPVSVPPRAGNFRLLSPLGPSPSLANAMALCAIIWTGVAVTFRPDRFEAHILDRIRFPVAIIEMPPLVFVDGKTSGFRLPAQEVAQTASFRGAAGIAMRVRTSRLNDELARVRSPRHLCAVRAE